MRRRRLRQRDPEDSRRGASSVWRDLLFFPACEKGAYKLSNDSLTETLVYLDFDTCNEIDVAFYPDSQKIGIWGKEIKRVYKLDENVEYYDVE